MNLTGDAHRHELDDLGEKQNERDGVPCARCALDAALAHWEAANAE